MHVHCSVLFPIFFFCKYNLLYVNFSNKFRDQSPLRCQRFTDLFWKSLFWHMFNLGDLEIIQIGARIHL